MNLTWATVIFGLLSVAAIGVSSARSHRHELLQGPFSVAKTFPATFDLSSGVDLPGIGGRPLTTPGVCYRNYSLRDPDRAGSSYCEIGFSHGFPRPDDPRTQPHDPCFVIESMRQRLGVDPRKARVCFDSPFNRKGFLVYPIKWRAHPFPSKRTSRWQHPWGLELPDGVRCTRMYLLTGEKYECFTTPPHETYLRIDERFIGWAPRFPTVGGQPRFVEFKWNQNVKVVDTNPSIPLLRVWK